MILSPLTPSLLYPPLPFVKITKIPETNFYLHPP
jgi:hypothetical protein